MWFLRDKDQSAEMREEWVQIPLTEDEKLAIEKIRLNLRKLPQKVEAELESESYLIRWLHEFKGNPDLAEAGAREYIESREAAGLDMPDYDNLWEHQRLVKEFLPLLSMSKFRHRVVNSKDNCVVVFGRAAGVNYSKIAHAMRSSEIILTYFAYGEYVMRQVVQQEKDSGKVSGATCVFDLSDLHVSEFVTSGSALLHISRMTINVMQKWYNTEGLKALIFLNPPKIMLFSWTFAKMIMNDQTRKKIHLLTKPSKQLPSLLSPDCIPQAFGGQLRDDTGWAEVPELCVNKPRVIMPEHYAIQGEVWARYNLPVNPLPPMTSAYVSKKGRFSVEKECRNSGEKLAWMYWINGEIEFEITKVTGDGTSSLAYPRLSLTTIKLPEEGVLICEAGTTYTLSWTNLTSYVFDIRLDYAVILAAPDHS